MADSGAVAGFAEGDAVRAYYDANDHPDGFRYARLPNGTDLETVRDRPVIGLTTGWISATVHKVPTDGSKIYVRLHGVFADPYHKDAKPVKNMWWRVQRTHLRAIGTALPRGELSLLVVRWWDYFNNKTSRCHNVANENMLHDVVQGKGSIRERFHETCAYEVYTAFVRSSEDVGGIDELVLPKMRYRCRAGLYFLWPVQRKSVEGRQPGSVSEPALIGLMGRMEAAGARTCWPHPTPLYRTLAGKMWVAGVSQTRPDLRVPLTVQVNVRDAIGDCAACAVQALDQLTRMQTRRDKKDPGVVKGVVKLGFSWMGADVRPFTGQEELCTVMRQMLDGLPDDAVCLVQERVEAVACECRLISCRDRAGGEDAVKWELVYMKQKPARQFFLDNTFTLAGHERLTPAEATSTVFGGSDAEREKTAAEVERLGREWLKWFRDQGHGTPGPAFRLDFLISRPPRGGTQVWTVELCECGGSVCGMSTAPRAAAFTNECIADVADGHTGASDDGRPLPPGPLPPLWQPPPDRQSPSQLASTGAGAGASVASARQPRSPGPQGGSRWRSGQTGGTPQDTPLRGAADKGVPARLLALLRRPGVLALLAIALAALLRRRLRARGAAQLAIR